VADALVRNLPEPLSRWLDSESHERGLSRNALIKDLLEMSAKDGGGNSQSGRSSGLAASTYSLPFSFIDLFAGIGGMRLGLEAVGGRSVFSSEWDPHSQATYHEWFKERPEGDINEVDPESIPDHDVLAAGFPCQPFSIAGVSKKNSLGRQHGFLDAAQGTLFFSILRILQAKRPPVVLLENVKNLRSHGKGTTWKVIRGSLEDLGYKVFDDVINAIHWVPQNRERVFIVCFDRDEFGDDVDYSFPTPPDDRTPRLRDVLDQEMSPEQEAKYVLSDKLWSYLQGYKAKHQAKGNGFGFGLISPDGTSRTLSARYFKDGSEILVPRRRGNPRRLTPREAQRLMGFPSDLRIVVSDTQAYRQFGNAVVPEVVRAVGEQIVDVMGRHLLDPTSGCLIKRVNAAPRDGAMGSGT
jgi:DNA (cytosine-5)-methyltransferase 1